MNRPVRQFVKPILLLLSVSALAACSSPLAGGPYADWVNKDPASWTSPSSSSVHHEATLATDVPAGKGVVLPAKAGSDDYVRLALVRNPEIKAAQEKVAELKQRIAQVTSLDDPMFTVAPVGQMAETAAGRVELMAGLSQKLPTPGKLATKGRIAQQMVAMAQQDLADTRLKVMAETRRAYWSYYFTSRAIEVIAADRQLLQQFHDAAVAKYKAGTAQQQDVLRASVELSNLDNRLITLRQQQTTATAMLNRLLDRRITAPLPTPPRVKLAHLSLQLDRLLAEAAQSNPMLAKIRDRIEAYRQREKLAQLNYWPDLTVSLNYAAVEKKGLSMAANGRDQWWLGFGVNLPIWQGKRNAARQEATHGLLSSVADLTNAQNTIAFRVQDAMVRVDTEQRVAVLMRDVIVPQARQTVEVSASGYQAGKTDFLTLVDNWRKLLDYELMYHQSLAQFEQALAELQQVVGRDLPVQVPAGKDKQP